VPGGRRVTTCTPSNRAPVSVSRYHPVLLIDGLRAGLRSAEVVAFRMESAEGRRSCLEQGSLLRGVGQTARGRVLKRVERASTQAGNRR